MSKPTPNAAERALAAMLSPAADARAELTAQVDSGTAKIRIYQPINAIGSDWGFVSAIEFAELLDGLGPNVTTIELHLNSPGGSIFEGIAIMNLLRAHSAQVVAVVDSLAASAASFIACAADQTIMMPNSEMMIHDGLAIVMGNAADLRSTADRLDSLSNNIASVYAAKSGDTAEFWREAMLAESWYTADEAVEAGLADRVATTTAADDQGATNSFDLSIFNYAGREKAPTPPIHGSTATTPAEPAPEPPSAAAAGSRADSKSAIDALDLELQLADA